ncbi:flagellar hook-length control protein FliK [Bosea sp. BIWAKO-01]|uniref:flagellar hook-length control protein FliK n=1 Tax=Bosea sp. BIWAKO-01 TaxID=506668 RepID=UPI000853AD76|nr:flagellar hook-length control protein FliK [Bosea sp. BIWAKO-01]GAU83773.1 hypothetical protein BIWAKO_03701 [Bosea sp. BIWAKO-01]
MNLAALVQSQTLATLLAALAPGAGLEPGKTVEARLLSLGKDGTATALIDGVKIDLVLAGPEVRQAALQPGTMLTLKIEAPEDGGTGVRATLLAARQPGEALAPPAQLVPIDGPRREPALAPLAPETGRSAKPPVPQAAPPGLPASSPRLIGASSSALLPIPATIAAAPASAQLLQSEAAPSPRALAGPLMGEALARQDSLAPLFANLQVLANGTISLVLPKPLMGLIDQILAQAMPAERRPVTGKSLKQAVARSGLFLDAQEARLPSRASDRAEAAAPGVSPHSDLKAGLRALGDMLRPLVAPDATAPGLKPARAEPRTAEQAASEPEAHIRPSPPRRDGALAPQSIAEPSLSAGEKPLVIARTLLDQTEAALDRVKLAQFASLPPEPNRPEVAQGQRWVTEIPLAFQAGAAILPLHIEKDPPRRGPSGVEAPLWRVRFALDAEPMGPLQGVVTLQGRAVSVSLWAEREGTSQFLRGAAPDLQAALANAQFEDGTVDIHTGQPQARRATAGQFLDRLS